MDLPLGRWQHAGISPDGLRKPLPQVFFRVRHHHDAGTLGMLEHMVRTVHPVKHPAGLPHLAYQVGAGHLCMIHIDGYSGKAPTVEKAVQSETHRTRRSGLHALRDRQRRAKKHGGASTARSCKWEFLVRLLGGRVVFRLFPIGKLAERVGFTYSYVSMTYDRNF